MDTALYSAIAIGCGSLVGAIATIVIAWFTQRAKSVEAKTLETRRQCEALYGEFITEASRLVMEAYSHALKRPDTFVKLYGIIGRIRLVATAPVLSAAEACLRQIIDLYSKPNMSIEQIRLAFERDRLDPVREFSVSCRNEPLQIAGGGSASIVHGEASRRKRRWSS